MDLKEFFTEEEIKELHKKYPPKFLGQAENLEGKIFGRWRVLYRTLSSKDKCTLWVCRCECEKHTIKTVKTKNLLKGDSQSCGCLQQEHKLINDDIKIHIRDEKGNIVQKRCYVCKQFKDITQFYFSSYRKDGYSGICKTCDKETVNSRYNKYKKGARKRNLNFDLTKIQFDYITKQSCFYCGENELPYRGIDRINSNKSYYPGNIVPCCEECNRMKMAYPFFDFLIRVEKIYNNFFKGENMNIFLKIPQKCPCCNSDLSIIISNNGVKNLKCENPDCPEKNLSKFTQFVSKQGMNIDGLSEKKLEALVEKGYITDFLSIYNLKNFPQIADLEGFGKKSYQNLLNAIDKSRTVKLNNFLVALSIPNVGKTVAKTIYKCFKGNFGAFLDACSKNFDFSTLDDIGEVISSSILDWYNNPNSLDNDFILTIVEGLREPDDIDRQVVFFDKSEFETKETDVNTTHLGSSENYNSTFCQNKTFVVTGKFEKYKRDELEKMIEDRGGKLASSVSKKTDFLLTNDSESGSSKAKKAKELNIPILSEDDFLEKVGLN